MTSPYITDRGAMHQAALEFARRYYAEIDAVALREACVNDRFLVEVVQNWRDKVASGAFMSRCALEQETPFVGSSLAIFRRRPTSQAHSPDVSLDVAVWIVVCMSILLVGARSNPMEDLRNGLRQISRLASMSRGFLTNCRKTKRRPELERLIENGAKSASQPSQQKLDVQKQGIHGNPHGDISSIERQKKRKVPPAEAEDKVPSPRGAKRPKNRSRIDPARLRSSSDPTRTLDETK